ncbi:MAG: Si-specific NAD(P)(+) transhydrogenase [Nitrospira sp.]|jgi:NAD(P) transhydrogenase|uniref:Si-specific NAD(P)(+) transhydrogenase n=1 Tax=Nitrospira sp. ND1 TaxID=1658518 RepID=UPI0009BBD64A|nr:Si-specific NAD(P)(+) transhydrogenase [Nitrospira sp. ND1]MBK7420614.1 Si-specific NAD(P)(+) transhydrogenase [Nitrospira sp.]OYT23909.1 MAG: NAD(P)(+) transhydrogenase [Nitrospira sp. UW-LDO-02]MBK9996192.1 Si-specific NAD(P)(+) transhydrogenase [Nitrospira sp.]MBP6198408.1 Si-specific NAD(P)(+) transhydrogenase [Nitrospira sp.]MBP6204571.1 Si-specific NAD(P)(+) transhydrogenase [Nitrospira sp.]
MPPNAYDIVVVGSGPAGQKAAIQGAKAGKKVVLIEQEQGIGGNCVYRGTIPSKTLRETALQFERLKRSSEVFEGRLRLDVPMSVLLHRLDEVVKAHECYMADQLTRNSVTYRHGRARFLSPHEVELETIDGACQALRADTIVLATGSRPRSIPEIPVDHEHVLDSDSILSMIYLPRSLTVLGGGVIACEYASTFALLGVEVTLIDRAQRPLSFMDAEIVEVFQRSIERQGGRFYVGQTVKEVVWDGVSSVVARLANGMAVKSEKMLVALGRQPNIEELNLEAAGLTLDEKGRIPVNEYGQTPVAHIFAAGDMLGRPPALASQAMEDGRRAVSHALGLPVGDSLNQVPIGIYTIPEIASIGLDEEQAAARYRGPLVGRARFTEIAKGQITGSCDGLLKLIADPSGERLLGVQIVGEHATELIHLGQMALQDGATIDRFIDSIFSFPTFAEGYRVAALDILGQRRKRQSTTQAA